VQQRRSRLLQAQSHRGASTLGAVATLVKPIEVDALLEVVRTYCA